MQSQKNQLLNEVTIREQNYFRFHDAYNGKKMNVNFLVNDISLINIQALSSTINFSKEEKDDRLNIILVKEDGTAEMVDFTFARKYSIERRKLVFSKLMESICSRIQEQREDWLDCDIIEIGIDLELELYEIEKNFLEHNWDISYVENITANMYDTHNSKIRDIRKTHINQLIGSGITISSHSLANIEIIDNPYWKETEWFKLAFQLHSGQILYMILDISDPIPSNIGYGHLDHIPKYREFFGFDMDEIDENQLKYNIQEVLRYNLENKKNTDVSIYSLYWEFYYYAESNGLLYENE